MPFKLADIRATDVNGVVVVELLFSVGLEGLIEEWPSNN